MNIDVPKKRKTPNYESNCLCIYTNAFFIMRTK